MKMKNLEFSLTIAAMLLLTTVRAAKLSLTACKGDMTTLTCPQGRVVSLERVRYGRPVLGDPRWGNCDQGDATTDCPVADIPDKKLKKLKNLCRDKTQCDFKISKTRLGETCVGVKQIAIIDWDCVLGQRLLPPQLELNVTDINQDLTSGRFVAALPDHGAVVGSMDHNSSTLDTVVRVDAAGNTLYTYTMTSNSSLAGLTVDCNSAYVLQKDGALTKLALDGLTYQEGYTLETGLRNGAIMHDGRFLVCSRGDGQCSAWDLKTNSKEVVIDNIGDPIQAIRVELDCNTCYLVVQGWDVHGFQMFDAEFNKLFSTGNINGTYGTEDGQMGYPQSIAVLPGGEIVVADTANYRISEFSSSGDFVRQLLTNDADDIGIPFYLSYQHPHLWIGGSWYDSVRTSSFRLYQ